MTLSPPPDREEGTEERDEQSAAPAAPTIPTDSTQNRFEKEAFRLCIRRLNESRDTAAWAEKQGLPIASSVVAGSNTHWEEMTRIAMRAIRSEDSAEVAEEIIGKILAETKGMLMAADYETFVRKLIAAYEDRAHAVGPISTVTKTLRMHALHLFGGQNPTELERK